MKFNIISSFIIAFSLLMLSANLAAQASINTDNAAPDPSAMLDIQSNNRGFLVPRMTQDNRLAITTPANGLFLYQTDNDPGYYYNQGTPGMPEWARMAIQTSDLICESRIPIDSVFDGTDYFIDKPGSYYLTGNITITSNNTDGITIDTDNVTLDLNGYTLNGSTVGDDGIVILGDEDNIIIKNGIIENWGGDGVNAVSADQSIFVDLKIRNNGGDGLITDDNCLVYRCAAEGNGLNGIEIYRGSIIFNSIASNNDDNGLQCNNGSIIINSTSFGNTADGIDAGSGARVENCNTYDNGVFGIDISLGGQVINCKANENRSNGIDLSSSCLAMNNTANRNGRCWLDGSNCSDVSDEGAGIKAFFNAQIINNTCNNNIMGIRISSSDSYVSNNYCEGNEHAGIVVTSGGTLVIRNRAHNNGFNPIQGLLDAGTNPSGNIELDPSSSFGPIINVSSAGNIINTPKANNPYANFEY